MRFDQQDFRRRFGMNVFTVAAACAPLAGFGCWSSSPICFCTDIQAGSFFPEAVSRSGDPAGGEDASDPSDRPFIAQAGSPVALPPVNSKSRRSAAPA
jgi:hypothetical protein